VEGDEMGENRNEELVGVRELYHEATANIRFAKQQQWFVSHYLLIFYAALYWAHSIARSRAAQLGCEWVAVVDVVAILIAVGAAIAGVVFMFSFLGFLKRQRQRLNGIYEGYADAGFLATHVEKLWNGRVDDNFWRDKHMWLPLTAAQVGAAVWLVSVIAMETRLP
jgi:hypothetical protein